MWGLVRDHAGPVHVIATVTHRRARHGVILHRCVLDRQDIRARHGLRLTSPARTLEHLPNHSLDDAVDRARAHRLLTSRQLAELAATTRRPAIADDHGFTRSEAERLLKALTARAGLPQPLTNTRLHGREVDALWPAERLIVEVDSYAHHSPAARSRPTAPATRPTPPPATGRCASPGASSPRHPELVAARLAAALAVRPAEPTARRG